ncbi:hypothetical protein DL93DRAFT_2076431 [Clavulina sp. PMI_390]|nr:hypothetical protein DL93DRAFT_2076431 [Clavulina sp. PMI_390]
MIPSIIQTLMLLFSIYWTVSTAYHTVRRTIRVGYFFLKWGSIVALLLGGVGWLNPHDASEELTIPGAIASGWNVVATYLDLESLLPAPPSSPSSSTSFTPGKPWEKFLNLDASKFQSGRSRKSRGSRSGSASPFGGVNAAADVLSWIGNLRDGSWVGDDTVERELRQIWDQNKDVWRSADDFLNALRVPRPGAANPSGDNAGESDASASQARSDGTQTR